MSKKGLHNPLVAVTAAQAARETASKATDFLTANAKPILVGGVVVAGLYYGPKWWRNYRAEKYARANIANPNAIAASVIYSSFTRFNAPGFIGWFIGEIDIATNEEALNDIALQVTSLKDVSDAYYRLYYRTLAQDIQSGLSTTEMQEFYNRISAPSQNNDQSTFYGVGSILYVAAKAGIRVNKARKSNNGTWIGTSERFGNFQFDEKIGTVVAQGIVPDSDPDHAGKNYYIVNEVTGFWDIDRLGTDYGVVVQDQVKDKI